MTSSRTATLSRRTLANALAAMKPEWGIGDASRAAWKQFVHAFQSGEHIVIDGDSVSFGIPSASTATSEIEDALWTLHSYESNRDDAGRRYSEADITRMVAAVRSLPSATASPNVDLAKAFLRAHNTTLYGHLIKADDYYRLLKSAVELVHPSDRGIKHGD